MFDNAKGHYANILSEIRSAGLSKDERIIESPQGPEIIVGGRKVLNFCANNYLGLSDHPVVLDAAHRALHDRGYGLSSVRFICGTQDRHKELEAKLSEFLGTQDTILYGSAFDANGGLFETLLGDQDAVISASLNHASIIDGVRLCNAQRFRYQHDDMAELEERLMEAKSCRLRMIVTDGVFSMDGDIAKLPEIVEAAEEADAIVMVDDAHASGVLGRNGRGSIDHFDLHGRVHVQVGTLSKAIGVLGGYVAGSANLRTILEHRARPFLFSTSAPPAVAAACLAAIDVLETEPQLIERLWDNARFFKVGLEGLGFDTGHSETPITPVIVGKGALAMKLSDRLFEEGVFAQGIGFPTVPDDRSRVRTIVTAEHSREELETCLAAFEKVGRELAII